MYIYIYIYNNYTYTYTYIHYIYIYIHIVAVHGTSVYIGGQPDAAGSPVWPTTRAN